MRFFQVDLQIRYIERSKAHPEVKNVVTNKISASDLLLVLLQSHQRTNLPSYLESPATSH